MAGLSSVSFTSPLSPYESDVEDIARRQKMADLLQQQAMAPLPTTRMVGRVAIPTSPLEGIAKLAQGWAASGVRDDATAKQKELVRQLQGDASKWYGSGPQGQALPTSQEGTGSFDMAGTQTPQAPVTKQDRMQWLMQGTNNPFSAPIAQAMLVQELAAPKYHTVAPGASLVPEPAPGAPGQAPGQVQPVYSAPAKAEPPHTRTIQRGDQKVAQEFDPNTRQWNDVPGAVGPAFARQVAPIVQMGEHTAYSNVQPDGQGGFIGLSKKTGRMEKIPQQEGLTTPGQMTPSDITASGARVASGEPMSQVVPGFGNKFADSRAKVRSEAIAQIKAQNPGMDDAAAGRELTNRSIDYVAGKKSVGQLTTMLGATRQAVSQLHFNVDATTKAMDKLGESGIQDLSPIFTAISRGEDKWTGNPAYSELFFYMHAAAMESARILQGGQASTAQLHAGAAEEAKKWASANMTTPRAWKEGVAPAIIAEGDARIKTYEGAIQKQRIGGGAQNPPPSPGAPAGAPKIDELLNKYK